MGKRGGYEMGTSVQVRNPTSNLETLFPLKQKANKLTKTQTLRMTSFPAQSFRRHQIYYPK